MSAGDDDHDDDAQLKQLRAVWVTMRDEDPPDRGLAALMSAAREKAAELEQAASPSWWQRVLATLRRPPVLALATVTLLLGGALIVTQRASDMKADSVVETDDKNLSPVATPGPTDGYGDMSKRGEGVAGSGAMTTGAGAGSAATPEIATPVEVPPERQKPRDAKSPSKAKPTTATTNTATKPAYRPTDDALGRKEPSPPPELGGTVEAGPRGAGGGAPPVMSIAQDPAAAATDTGSMDEDAGSKPKPKKPIARTAPPSIEGEDRQVTKDTAKAAQPSIDQLVKQCETAAAKGDCAAVRVIAQKIQSTAPAAYKSRVANNAAINRCLPAPAPAAVSD